MREGRGMRMRDRLSQRLGEAFAVKNLQVVLPEVFGTAEEDGFRFRQSLCRSKLFACEFKSAGNVGNLKETISRRLDIGDEFRSGGEEGERFSDESRQGGLSVVVVHLELVKGVESRCVGNEELADFLQQGVVNVLASSQKTFVDAKAVIRDVRLAQESDHAVENAATFLTGRVGIVLLAANERPGMNAMVRRESHGAQRIAELQKASGQVNVLIMEYHSDHVKTRRARIGLKASRFVDEYADFPDVLFHGIILKGKTKARISPRLRQETFPLAGDAGFRPCRRLFYHNRICRRKGLISSRR